MNGVGKTIFSVFEQLWLPAVLIIWWWIASASSESPFFPPLSEIVHSFVVEWSTGDLIGNVLASLRNIGIGFGVGVLVGVAVGVLIGRSRGLRAVLGPYLQFARSVPQVALVPIIIGAFGITAIPKIWAIAFACIWPVLLNTVDGIRAIDPSVRDMTRSYQVKPGLELFRVMIPAALPQIMAGVRISLSIAVIVMVVSEIFGATEGLGYFINYSKGLFQTEATWMGTLLVGLLGYLLSTVFLMLEKRVLYWYYESAK